MVVSRSRRSTYNCCFRSSVVSWIKPNSLSCDSSLTRRSIAICYWYSDSSPSICSVRTRMLSYRCLRWAYSYSRIIAS